MALLTISDLIIGYDARRVAGRLNFTVSAGQIMAIVGENGSGKSTLMRTLLGLQKPLGGQIIYGEGLKRRQIGYLAQQSEIQKDFPAYVQEIVLSGCLGLHPHRPFFGRDEKLLAGKNMELMGITRLARRSYQDLSGGQQQRVLLARALCSAQRILFLDEPANGLDPMVSADMYTLLFSLKNAGIAVVMISHDVRAVLQNADTVLQVSSAPFFGSRDEYLESDAGRLFIMYRKGGDLQ